MMERRIFDDVPKETAAVIMMMRMRWRDVVKRLGVSGDGDEEDAGGEDDEGSEAEPVPDGDGGGVGGTGSPGKDEGGSEADENCEDGEDRVGRFEGEKNFDKIKRRVDETSNRRETVVDPGQMFFKVVLPPNPASQQARPRIRR